MCTDGTGRSRGGGPVLGAVIGLGSLLGSRLDPVAWDPPEPPAMEGALSPDRSLTDADRVATLDGPEDVAFDDAGRLYAGTADERIYRTVDPVDAGTTEAAVERFASVDGRPLGLEFHGEDLLVAATAGGLQSVSPGGSVTTLVERADGRPVAFADDVHVADDGTVYFTDATRHRIYQDELFELRDTGRLLAHDPETGETTVALGDLGFANGVVPGPDGDSLLVTETSRYRIARYWIDGDRAGERAVFARNLPGYPDNIDVAPDGGYWVALPSKRDATLDRLHRHPWLVRQFGRLPEAALELVTPDPYGLVVKVDADGDVVDSRHDPTGGVHYVTSATHREGALYLGTLVGDAVVRCPTS